MTTSLLTLPSQGLMLMVQTAPLAVETWMVKGALQAEEKERHASRLSQSHPDQRDGPPSPTILDMMHLLGSRNWQLGQG